MIRQATTVAGAAVVVAAVGLVILAAGPSLRSGAPGETGAAPEPVNPVAVAPAQPERPAAVEPSEPEGTGSAAPVGDAADTPVQAAPVAPAPTDAVAEPDQAPLERLPARPPLSELSLALPPKPPLPGDWKPTILPRPVASGAGLIEAKGYRIALEGIEPVDADEQCTFEGTTWPCGVGARTAFRAFLRGRSVSCVVPPQADREIIVAPCMVGKQDLAAWLVENGWARARPGSDYVALGETAEQARKGMFGRPPPSATPAPVALDSALPRPPSVDGSILAPSGFDAAGEVQVGPLPPPLPEGPFPTPPAPPPAPAQ